MYESKFMEMYFLLLLPPLPLKSIFSNRQTNKHKTLYYIGGQKINATNHVITM